MNPETFPLARGVPMELLTLRGLSEAFLDVVEEHRRNGVSVVIRRDGQLMNLPADELTPEVTRARNRITELSAEIAKYQRSQVSVNETPAD